jgi:hypothetical protein
MNRFYFAHEVTLMSAMCVIEAKYAALIYSGQMWQEESEIVLNDLALSVDPDFLAKNADPSGTPKPGFVIGFLAMPTPPAQGKILAQVMHILHHLCTHLLSALWGYEYKELRIICRCSRGGIP